MNTMIELVAGVVTDTHSNLLLAQSRNHGWWELPGTRIGDEAPEAALEQALRRKLGLTAEADEASLPFMGSVEVDIAGIGFRAAVHQVRGYGDYPMETLESGYKEITWVNPTHRQLGRLSLSPIAKKFLEPYKDPFSWLRAVS